MLRENGIGPGKIGMRLRELNAALHETFAMPVIRGTKLALT
jgi:hypothetical protein